MESGHNPQGEDAVGRDAEAIADLAGDLKDARARELAIEKEECDLDEQIAALQRKKAELELQRRELRERELRDEQNIADKLDDIDCTLDGGHGGVPPERVYEFFVDTKPYSTELPRLTGLQIKAKVPDWDPTHDLVLEGAGTEADRLIADSDEVDFARARHPLCFSSAPKANFG